MNIVAQIKSTIDKKTKKTKNKFITERDRLDNSCYDHKIRTVVDDPENILKG